ncbi:MAG TPA: molecular chaperone DnaK [Acidobacteriota bacterium]|nr:molecular chaperone DnaK [Acidobacteriota bacterium]HQO19062.1 molecular chaperone DnaK [Acidobacteriota bacterium]HQQ45955.1 molecular chaperone DnaK [Acidobacteriota bacterium]
MAKVIGIDLGTTNSCMAFIEGGEPTIIPSREGGRTLPSIVAFTEQGERLVGNLAKRQAVTNPTNTIYAVKRLIGKKYGDATMMTAREVLPYQLVEAPNGDIRIKTYSNEYSSQEISAFILSEIKKSAEEFFGEEVAEAVITVPAYFSDPQRQATKDAGRIAGLDVLRILNEPTAACLAFNLEEAAAKTVAVYDLGGGTFDISILRLGEGLFEVIATAGDTYLGGEDMDQSIMREFMKRFERDTSLDLAGDRMALQRLKEAAERAKCDLSVVESVEINLPFIAADANGPKHLQTTLTRAQLEDLIRDTVEKTKAPCQEALKIAGISVSDIDEVLLVGGQTRTPMVIQTVKEIFGKDPRRDKNPDEVVALGAALQAGILKGDVKEIVLLDSIPLSLGVSTKGNLFVKLIERGSAIPTKKGRIFTTVADNQDSVEIHVLQGEREISSENISLGKFDLVGIPPAPKGLPQVEVTFDINANGIVSVYAKDLMTGNEQKIVVNPSSGLSEDEIQRIIDDAKAREIEDKRAVEIQKLKLKLERLVESIEKSFAEFGALLDAETKTKAENAIKQARKEVLSESSANLHETFFELSDISHKITEAIMNDPLAQMGIKPDSEDAPPQKEEKK